ncbi:MAG: 1,2-phenylacetyl-CoA epoxidase subunit PaaB [Sphingomonadales bacterium]|nr:1,2-phenylacetyl-CoA epoxidase subunit B [Sphingomonadales bacterium]
MIIKSLDPRITRAGLDDESKDGIQQPMDQWFTYEVFQQKKRGTHHVHVGSLHAPDSELAILFAKEQYARRGQCVNLWVVKTADVFATEYEDEDIFATTPEKKYREPEVYKVMDRIQAYKAKQNS